MTPKGLWVYFDNKRYLFKNLETISQIVRVGRAEPIMQEWKDLIATACRKHNGEVVDVQEAVKVAEAKLVSFNDSWRGIAAVGHDLQINLGSMGRAERADKLLALGQRAGKATPVLKYLDEWLSETKYAASGETECRNYSEERFSKQFKYWEVIGADELKAYIRGRQNGTDGANAWSDSSCEIHSNWVKQFWNWILDNDHTNIPFFWSILLGLWRIRPTPGKNELRSKQNPIFPIALLNVGRSSMLRKGMVTICLGNWSCWACIPVAASMNCVVWS